MAAFTLNTKSTPCSVRTVSGKVSRKTSGFVSGSRALVKRSARISSLSKPLARVNRLSVRAAEEDEEKTDYREEYMAAADTEFGEINESNVSDQFDSALGDLDIKTVIGGGLALALALFLVFWLTIFTKPKKLAAGFIQPLAPIVNKVQKL
mmetsp:Transcript_535/g.621  ORF Transcript_535/g.621 Transcript_535/m.621 type:complete len:151 (-) Transcript_535:510-962(-)|eukprot:CAMPEP_0197866852 /NCGR_PEP_ID=MMETSP1438-20131217/44441_1 /TAXON_ID=1461541 /ORGANISM="Pterosperma sp., Strain CCMP1384" /LENGTH=150 /DNA_ID=CAMNT_0043485457 /DNA_START=66 /DNA_END=518 /DNA_ORIENTATION=-